MRLYSVIVLSIAIVFGVQALATERYYMITFGVQDAMNRFVTAHTFAVFVRAEEKEITQTKMISWLPASGKVCLFCPAEDGRNYPLDQSLEEPTHDGRTVTAWGPFEIQAELYRRAVNQSDSLDRGVLLYKAIDEPYRHQGIATNCEHAVSDIDTDNGFIYTGTAHGNRGTRHVTQHLQRWVNQTGEDLDWLFSALKIDHYPIRRGKL